MKPTNIKGQTRQTIGQVTIPHVIWYAVAGAVAAVSFILYLTRDRNFFFDEWNFAVASPSWTTLESFLQPHNEHWVTLAKVIWKSLQETYGLGSYRPYIATLALLHTGCAILLFRLIRHRSGELLALLAALVFMFFGSGGHDLVFAFQITFVGSIFFGLTAMNLFDRLESGWSNIAAASAALLISLMFSGVGLFFLAAIGVDLLADRKRRSYLIGLFIPALAYALWHLRFGHSIITNHPAINNFSLWDGTGLLLLVRYIAYGIGSAGTGLFGLSSRWSTMALLSMSALLALWWYQRGHINSHIKGALAGLLTEYGLSGIVRSHLGVEWAATSRYIDVAAVFLLLILTDALRDFSWDKRSRVCLVGLSILAIANNAVQLAVSAEEMEKTIRIQNAELRTIMAFRGAPDMNQDVNPDEVITPQLTSRTYFMATDRFGSPLPATDLEGLRSLPADGVDKATRRVFVDGLTIAPVSNDKEVEAICPTMEPLSTSTLDLLVHSANRFYLKSDTGGTVRIYFWYWFGPHPEGSKQALLRPGTPFSVKLPDTGRPIDWHVRIESSPLSQFSVCIPHSST